MADNDKLWFELGVRDNVSDVLKKILKDSEDLDATFSSMTQNLESFYKNAVNKANETDKAAKKLHDTFADLDKRLGKIANREVNIEVTANESSALKNIESLIDKLSEKKKNIQKEINSILPFNGKAPSAFQLEKVAPFKKEIEDIDKHLNALYATYEKLSHVGNAFVPGSSIGLEHLSKDNADAAQNRRRRQRELTEDFNAHFEKIAAKERQEKEALDALNKKLRENQIIRESLARLIGETETKATVAKINEKTAAYEALNKKYERLRELQEKVDEEGRGIRGGTGGSSLKYTRTGVSSELEAIQRKYNVELAIGEYAERRNAESKAASAKRAMELAAANRNLMQTYHQLRDASAGANKFMQQIQYQFGNYVGLYGMERLVRSIITIGGQFEFQHKALQNIIGDVNEANTLFSQLQDLAVESPKTFMELTQYTKQLSAYQIPTEELFDTTKRLADLSTGLGVDMGRLILAYGQVRSAAVLRGQELRQFTEAGIPLVQKLAEKFTELNGRVTTTGEVFGLISKRQVSFDMVKDILWDMTSEGGQFYNMQAELADTLYGKYQKLQDSWQIMLGHIADGKSLAGGFFRVMIEGVVALVNSLDSLLPVIGLMAGGRLLSNGTNSLRSIYQSQNGNSAILTMQKAKMQDIVRLERERLMYGKALTTEERNLVKSKGQLVSQDYYLLGLEGQISDRKIAQLWKDKEMTDNHARRLLLMKGYTKEQIKQIQAGNINIAKGGPSMMNKAGSAVLGFMGGWLGVAMAAIGGVVALWDRASQQAQAAADVAKKSASSMLSDYGAVKNLYDELTSSRPSTSDDMASAVDKMTRALQKVDALSGETQKKLAEADGINEKYRILHGELERVSNDYILLKENVEAYLEAAGRSGEGNWFTRLFTDNMAEDLKDLSEASINKRRMKKQADEYGALLKTTLLKYYKDIKKSIPKDLSLVDWEALYQGLDDVQRLSFESYFTGVGGATEKARLALNDYLASLGEYKSALKEVESQMPDYRENIYIALEDVMKFRGLDLKDILKWSPSDFDALNKAINEALAGFDVDKDTAEYLKGKILELFPEEVRPKIKPFLDIDPNSLQQWQKDLNDYFKKNGINITVSADDDIEKVEKKLKEAHNTWKQTIETSKPILLKMGVKLDLSNFSAVLEKLKKTQPLLSSFLDQVKKDFETAMEADSKIEKAAKDLGFSLEDEKKKGDKKKKTGKGSSEDKELENARTLFNEYKSFYNEYQKYYKRYQDKALPLVEAMFPSIQKKGVAKSIVDDFDKALRGLKVIDNGLKTRINFNTEVDRYISGRKFDNETEAIKRNVDAMKEWLDKMGKQWKLYHDLYKKTGDESFASLAFGEVMDWDDVSQREYARLKELIKERAKADETLKGLFGENGEVGGFSLRMTREAATDIFGGKNADVVELYMKLQELMLKNGETMLEQSAAAKEKALTEQEKLNELLREREEIDKKLALLPEDRVKERQGLIWQRKAKDKEISKQYWEVFKVEHRWGRVFGDLDNVSFDTIKEMIDAMEGFSDTIDGEDVETVKAFQEALQKLIDKKRMLAPLKGITEYVNDYNKAAAKRDKAQTVYDYKRGKISYAEARRRGLTAEELDISEEKAKQNLLDAKDDEVKAINNVIKAVAAFGSQVSQAGSALTQLGNQIGGKGGKILGGFGAILTGSGNSLQSLNSISANASTLSNVMAGVTAVSSTASAMIEMNNAIKEILPNEDKLYKHYANKQKAINDMRAAIEDYRIAVAEAQKQEATWFYGNGLTELRAEAKKNAKVMDAYFTELYEPQEIYRNKKSSWKKHGVQIALAIAAAAAVAIALATGGAGVVVAAGLAAGASTAAAAAAVTMIAAIGALSVAAGGIAGVLGQFATAAYETLTYEKNQTAAIQNLRIETRRKSTWHGQRTADLREWVKEKYGEELFDENGLINIELTENLLENYGDKLVGETKDTVERLLELAKEMKEFKESVQKYVSEAFSPLVDNMTDAFWDWLRDGRDVMSSFRDYASDTFKKVAEDAVKAFLNVQIFDKYKDQLEGLYAQYGTGMINEETLFAAVAALGGQMGYNLQNLVPTLQRSLQIMADAGRMNGFDIVNGGTGANDTLSQGIKGVTETTADIIASYMNAMRADVSMNRGMMATYYPQFLNTMSEGNMIANAQLTQLGLIVQNTNRNAGLVEQIYTLLNRCAPDGDRINVS